MSELVGSEDREDSHCSDARSHPASCALPERASRQAQRRRASSLKGLPPMRRSTLTGSPWGQRRSSTVSREGSEPCSRVCTRSRSASAAPSSSVRKPRQQRRSLTQGQGRGRGHAVSAGSLLLACALAATLSGCATTGLATSSTTRGKYDPAMFAYYKDPTKEADFEAALSQSSSRRDRDTASCRLASMPSTGTCGCRRASPPRRSTSFGRRKRTGRNRRYSWNG